MVIPLPPVRLVIVRILAAMVLFGVAGLYLWLVEPRLRFLSVLGWSIVVIGTASRFDRRPQVVLGQEGATFKHWAFHHDFVRYEDIEQVSAVFDLSGSDARWLGFRVFSRRQTRWAARRLGNLAFWVIDRRRRRFLVVDPAPNLSLEVARHAVLERWNGVRNAR